jgi:hypothetical protein
MPKLTEYLLKLSTDPKELERYREVRAKHLDAASAEGTSVAIDYLTANPGPGLTEEHARIVLGHDSHEVVKAVTAELATESSRPDAQFYGIPITFVTEANGGIQQSVHTTSTGP